MTAAEPAGAPSPANDSRAKRLGVRIHPLEEFRRIWKAQTRWKGRKALPPIWNSREAKALSALIVHASNEDGLVNGPRTPEQQRVGLSELARRSKQSKSSFLRAMKVLVEHAGVVEREKKPREDDPRQNEINVYRLLPERLAEWTGKDRPNHWDPLPKPRGGGSVTVNLPPTATCAGGVAGNPADPQGKEGGGVVSACPGSPTAHDPCPPPRPEPPPEQLVDELDVAPQAPPPVTLAELAAQRPADELLTVLVRGAERGHPWCASVAQRLLERGGRLTDNERKALRRIRDEGEKTSQRVSALQPKGPWRPKGRAPS